jgi:chromosome partitioning protein
MACRIYAIAQQKGGVGKTTTTLNLGAALVEKGHRVLMLDLDPQGALSTGVGLDALALRETIYDVLRNRTLPLSSIIVRAPVGCDLAPANIDLAASEMELVSEPGRERILNDKLRPMLSSYDFILLDCPPALGLLTLNALSAATRVIIPVETKYLALRGMELLLDTIGKVQARINPDLEIGGILPTLHDSRTTHHREVLDELRETYGDKVYKTVIPNTIKLADSIIAGQSILQFSAGSPAAQSYRDLAEEVIARG